MINKELSAKADKICAVVVTYNRKALLKDCLTALMNQTRRLNEIFVIDNASTDGTDSLVKTCFPAITYVKLDNNVGGAGGFHDGMKLAFEKGYDWIWVMDDDAVPMSDALDKLASSPAMTRDKVYGLASAVLNRDESICLLHRRMLDRKNMKEKAIDSIKYKEQYFEMDTASFVGFLINRKAIKEAGLPLKSFFIYFDDTEYSLRIRQRGILVTVPDSKIIHGVGETNSGKWIERFRNPPDWKQYYLIRNQIYTFKKHGKPGLANYIKPLVAMAAGMGITLFFGRYKIQRMKIMFCGTIDGLRGKLGKTTAFLPN